jgi:hypothetical protein
LTSRREKPRSWARRMNRTTSTAPGGYSR